MIFFVSLAWLFALRIADQGRLRDYLLGGAFAGAAIGSKYSAAFILGVIGVAHLVAPRRPQTSKDVRGWLAWTARGLEPARRERADLRHHQPDGLPLLPTSSGRTSSSRS